MPSAGADNLLTVAATNMPTGTTVADQRGVGFGRVSGGVADIGAYERQPDDDEIFHGGFR